MPERLRRALRPARAWLRRRPRASAGVARALRRLGGPTVAARVERQLDLTWVDPPGAAPFHLLRLGGQDQVARQVAEEGWDSFEAPLPAVLAALVRARCRHGVFADIGANTGYYALLAAACEPTASVHAYEPYPPVLALLRTNAALNRNGRIEVRGVAVGAEVGTATLYVPLPDHGLVETSSSLNPSFDDTRIGSTVEVAVTTLDRLYPVGAPEPSVLKVDVESLEPAVLAGGDALLARCQPIVVLELLPTSDPAPLEAVRARHGYVDIRLRPGHAVVGGPVRPDPDAWNHLWCSEGSLADVRALLADAGLALVEAEAT